MKKFLMILVSLAALNTGAAFARTPSLDGILSIAPTAGRLVSVEPLCPEGVTCITDGTVLNLAFDMNGCANSLGPVSYTAEERNGELHVYVSALELFHEASRRIRCYRMPTVNHQITLINQYGDVRLHFLTSGHEFKKLPSDANGLYFPDVARVKSISPLCPEGMMCIYGGSVVEVEFEFGGCVDKLGPVSYTVEEREGDLHVYVSTRIMASRTSLAALCEGPRTATKKLNLVNQYGNNILVHFVK